MTVYGVAAYPGGGKSKFMVPLLKELRSVHGPKEFYVRRREVRFKDTAKNHAHCWAWVGWHLTV